jgi:ferredoxin
MTVLDGFEALPSASSRETALLTKLGAGWDQRLGCQCPMPDPTADLLITTGYW